MCKNLLTAVSDGRFIWFGEYTFLSRERALGKSRLIEFCGRDRVHAQRKAVDWWFTHGRVLGLRLREFLLRCQWSDDQRTITFIHP